MYYVYGEYFNVASLESGMFLISYLSEIDCVFVTDKTRSLISYKLSSLLIDYHIAVLSKDFKLADQIIQSLPKSMLNDIAHFLEKQGFPDQAILISDDDVHKFELAIQIRDIDSSLFLANELMDENKWKQVADLALSLGDYEIAKECLKHVKDYSSLLLMAASNCDQTLFNDIIDGAITDDLPHIGFLASFCSGKFYNFY
ncbi:coatomer subunit beta'-like [Octopus sinensis]|uniref:Coatomer subunit beta'-like n=1 Tax=Octopus sinensis TaxID=2607531 RepID=A0A6P7TUN9_9MOLL|nr:coatomer subunit beta'-like [Octopus sinensis]